MIGERIQQKRQELGMSMSELAERAGVAKSYLSAIEKDPRANPSVQFLEKISVVLNVTPQSLMTEDDSELDREWLQLAKDAAASGVTKEQFREFLEFQKWKLHQTNPSENPPEDDES